ncbi:MULTISPECIES: SH3 domain-containing protein [unclassified Sphingobacterium]|uniref:SH3 domain-containing protein n=1 Tax=unclassified Sphingobacterium TaxID=2609468 RepID=UPI00265D069E|nr:MULTISPECIES: SH3 domain-containing protein [unclassified Sphingobacterium]WKK59755.1 SH3 domain-containing protein [Sphingobacterium sp. BN32]
MSLESKYKVLIDTANASGIEGLQIAEMDGVLQIRGTAPNADVKNKLWDVYNQIDPNFLSGDVVMNVDVSTAVTGQQVRVITESSNLNIRKGPGTDQPIVGKAAKDEVITLISRANDQWWLVRTKDGEEGYCYAQYLEPIS